MPHLTPRRVRARTRAGGAAIAAVCALAAGCGGGADADTTALNGATRTPPSQVGDLTLPAYGPDGNGPTASRLRPEHGLLIAYFGFTSCPDVCPTSLADLGAALDELTPAEREQIAVAMVTVDPERDTPKVLTTYLGHFFAGRAPVEAFRTTDERALARAERAFGASHEIGEPDAEGDYDVTHTAQLYAVDRRGTVVVEWPFGASPEDMAADLRALLSQT